MTSPIPGPRTKLGTTGLEVCRLGFGGIPIQRLTEAEAVRLIGVALDGGIDFYDTAAGYTDSQRKLGAGLAGHRDRVVIASKSMARGAEAIAADLDRAL
ncbi:MAG TPA: aldo/keto reductase, partial [Candidatus Aminicenantes bacterium]|nr:aldo/keto reductase [Candidatus Aminicenantes bacterium]